jgi:hypothetical protein
MTLVHVPRPKQSALNPDRPVSGLLKAQILQLHDAERNLPPQYRTDIYINAIKTEGEAADYISRVTTAIRAAHEATAVKRGRGIAIAAAADVGPLGQRARPASRKRKAARGGRRS